MTVALVRETFFDDNARQRLVARLKQAKEAGADLAVLPELAVLPWSSATKLEREEDAEEEEGPRAQMQAEAAREAGIAALGSAIVRDGPTGERRNRCLVFDAQGNTLGSYDKVHLPQEPGFWETSHYKPGRALSRVFDELCFPFGIQICSDMNRPQGAQLLAAHGAMAVIGPRATERATYSRWLPVLIATARTNAVYVLSVDRPAPERGVHLGQPSVAIGPDGNILMETTDPIGVVKLDPEAVHRARKAYPGYLATFPALYAEGWAGCSDAR
jgi:predicted amidohydrolase